MKSPDNISISHKIRKQLIVACYIFCFIKSIVRFRFAGIHTRANGVI